MPEGVLNRVGQAVFGNSVGLEILSVIGFIGTISLVIGLLYHQASKKQIDVPHPLIVTLMFYIVAHIGTMVFASSFVHANANIQFIPRQLLPVQISLIVIVVYLIGTVWNAYPGASGLRAAIIGLSILYGVFYLVQSAAYIHQPRDLGYNSMDWKTSETMAAVKSS